jgi:hypothetical protein
MVGEGVGASPNVPHGNNAFFWEGQGSKSHLLTTSGLVGDGWVGFFLDNTVIFFRYLKVHFR